MRYGIHLPHAGEQATSALVRRHAERAEDLGLDDVWVSEHIIVPRDGFPRSPLFFDPVLSLTWAAAVTKRIGLGTSVRHCHIWQVTPVLSPPAAIQAAAKPLTSRGAHRPAVPRPASKTGSRDNASPPCSGRPGCAARR